ncbi:hypothetical protein [Nocardiopsis kunsanensis]|uniref:hypothetical protein n=1 Tax=Nocardiopsis kunsanensis TaxID=141693 RepID=UPI001874C432|nr:hypothetical protein [Nocardiopsis kunsanensis]
MKGILFLGATAGWMASLYALDESNGFVLLMEAVPDKAGYRFAVASIFISWSIFAIWVVGKIQDPKKVPSSLWIHGSCCDGAH